MLRHETGTRPRPCQAQGRTGHSTSNAAGAGRGNTAPVIHILSYSHHREVSAGLAEIKPISGGSATHSLCHSPSFPWPRGREEENTFPPPCLRRSHLQLPLALGAACPPPGCPSRRPSLGTHQAAASFTEAPSELHLVPHTPAAPCKRCYRVSSHGTVTSPHRPGRAAPTIPATRIRGAICPGAIICSAKSEVVKPDNFSGL